MRRAIHIAVKDVLIWVRDIAALGVLLAMPVVLILILGSAFGGASQASIPVAVVQLDLGNTKPDPRKPPTSSVGIHENLGEELLATIRKSERLAEVFEIDYDRDEADAREAVAAGDLSAALIIPVDFSKRVQAGEPVELEVVKDPGAGLSAGIWESVMQGFAADYSSVSVVVQTAIEGVRVEDPELIATEQGIGEIQRIAIGYATSETPVIEVVDAEADTERELEALDYFAVSMSAMFLMFGAMFGAFTTIRERRERTLARMMASPTSSAVITGGKMLGIFALGMAQFTVLFFATKVLFKVWWGEDMLAIFAVAAAEVLAVTGFAVLVGALASSERGAGGIAPLVIQVQALLGGAFFPIDVLPEWLQPIRYTSVIGWAMEGWRTVQLHDGGLADVTGPIAAMLGFAVVLFAAGTMLTKARR